jgi:hypothetical protein
MSNLADVYQLLVALCFALPALGMSARLFQVWRAPLDVDGGRWVHLGVSYFASEFVLLQAGAMIGAIVASGGGTTYIAIGYLALLYCYIIWVVARSSKSTVLVWSMLGLVVGRGIAVLLGASQDDALLLFAHSIVGGVLYVVMVLASLIVPFPRLGITPELAHRLQVPGASSAWKDSPEQAIGAGAVYFLLLGLTQMALLSWFDVRAFIGASG